MLLAINTVISHFKDYSNRINKLINVQENKQIKKAFSRARANNRDLNAIVDACNRKCSKRYWLGYLIRSR